SSFWAANAVDHVNSGLFLTWTLVFLGITPFVVGLGMARSATWPTWIGVLGGLGGAVCIVVASIMFVQTDSGSQDVAFLVGSLRVPAWFLCAGVWALRPRASESAPAWAGARRRVTLTPCLVTRPNSTSTSWWSGPAWPASTPSITSGSWGSAPWCSSRATAS